MKHFTQPQSRIGSSCTKWDRYKPRENLEDIIPLWVADMDFECCPAITQAIKKRGEHPIFGYTDPPQKAYDAVIHWEGTQHHNQISKEDIIFTTGVVYALYDLLRLLIKPNQKVVVQPPVYPPLFNTPKQLGIEVIENPLLPNGNMNLPQLSTLLSNDSSIRALILCNPHNPTGRCWTTQELSDVIELCKKHHVFVICDEIHIDITRTKATSLYSIDHNYHQNIFLLGSCTKTFNLAGIKIAYLLSKNHEINCQFVSHAKYSGSTSVNVFGYEALYAAYQFGHQWHSQCLDSINENFNWIKKFCDEHLPLCQFEIPQATYLAWLDISAYSDNPNLKNDLKYIAKVDIEDGKAFHHADDFIRINVACPLPTLNRGMIRIRDFLKSSMKKS